MEREKLKEANVLNDKIDKLELIIKEFEDMSEKKGKEPLIVGVRNNHYYGNVPECLRQSIIIQVKSFHQAKLEELEKEFSAL